MKHNKNKKKKKGRKSGKKNCGVRTVKLAEMTVRGQTGTQSK